MYYGNRSNKTGIVVSEMSWGNIFVIFVLEWSDDTS
jgi:hypothetical protein